ncbi:MAG TPA: hypothetical protein VL225_02850 [Vicinamibacterales bacterium]|jgi:hypothetical protein|nr:hypothetical protein [Vicinamibacterales bacterium]
MTKSAADPFEVFSAEALKERRTAKSPRVAPVLRTSLIDVASRLSNHAVTLPETAAMTLTARHPFDPAGFMDVYKPGRWDCESNLVFMDVIVQTGPSVGEWDGSVVYARFTAPATGTYLIVGNFSGYQITMNMHGPWGNVTAYCGETSDHAQATALWAGVAGGTLFFTINLTGPIIGYLESVQTFLIS